MMKVDVLLKSMVVLQNGTTLKKCPGIVLMNCMPPGSGQVIYGGGRKVGLTDNEVQSFTDYRDQLEMRCELTGKSWVEVQVISMTDFGLLGKLLEELIGKAKDKWPLPVGSSFLDIISDDLKKGSPQVIGKGVSDVFDPAGIPKQLEIELETPADVLGDNGSAVDPVTRLPDENQPGRPLLLEKGSKNGKIVIEVSPA